MSLFIIAILLIFLSFIVHYHVKYHCRNKILSRYPSLPSYSLIGSNHNFLGKSAKELFDLFVSTTEKLGTVWKYDVSPYVSTFFITDPKIVEEILSSQKLIEKSRDYDIMRPWLADGKRN